ncbi:MAG: tetratricopeptide repeat protein [Saprospiraceae bacterium]|nr:tetratricopeptide repeat protein [Saprospiraceae bacterium]
MRSYLLIILVILSSAPGLRLCAQDEIAIANGYADKGQYHEAINAYNEILKYSGYEEVNYNLANCYLAVDSLPQAILHYERALRYDPNDVDVLNNLDIARSRVFDQVTVLPEFFLIEYWNSLVRWLSPNGWAGLSVILALLLALMFYLLTYGKINLRIRHSAGLMGLLLGLMVLSLAAGWSGKSKSVADDQAIILEEVLLKSGPDDRSNDVKVLYPGYKIFILDELSGWKKVRTEDREVGYVLPDVFKVI